MIHRVKAEPGKEPCEWKVVPYADVEADELFQVRFLDLFRVIDSTIWTLEERKPIKDAYLRLLLEGFTAAYLHLRNAISMSANPQTPILNRRAEFDSFYSKLWTAYEHRFADLTKAMGYKISFLFTDSDDTFQKHSAVFAGQHGISDEIMEHLTRQRISWQKPLADIRSKVVTHARKHADDVPHAYELKTVQSFFDQCWHMAEWFIAILLSRHLDSSFQLFVLPYEMSESGKKRFTVQLSPHVKLRK